MLEVAQPARTVHWLKPCSTMLSVHWSSTWLRARSRRLPQKAPTPAPYHPWPKLPL